MNTADPSAAFRRTFKRVLPRIFNRQSEFSRLTITQICIICFVSDGSSTMGDIARAFDLDAGSVSRIVERLVHREYLTREYDSRDQRLVLIRLGPKGERFVREISETFAQMFR